MIDRELVRGQGRRLAMEAVTASRAAVPLSAALRPRRPTPPDGRTILGADGLQGLRRLAVLAHHDPRSEVAESDLLQVAAFRAAGYATVVATTIEADPYLLWDQLRGSANGLIVRRNVGYDFGSWGAALDLLAPALANVDRLVLMNNSVYGPTLPWGPYLDRVFARGDVVGLTESGEFVSHAQSYFLAFSGRAVNAPGFLRWWSRIRPARSKWGTILAHEVRWQRDLTGPGLRAGVMVPRTDRGAGRNPLTFGWEALVVDGFPLVKKSLFLANPDHIDMTGWRDVLRRSAPSFDVGVIERDLRRRGLVPPA